MKKQHTSTTTSLSALTAVAISILAFALVYGLPAQSAPSGLTFQGRLMNDGQPVEGSSVALTIKIKSPGASECLLFEETHTLNMADSDGVFSIKIGGGARTVNDKGLSLTQVFSNTGIAINSLACTGGLITSYSPANTDSRNLYVSFVDGTDNVAFSSPYVIQSVPYAIEAERLAGKAATDFLQVTSDTTQTKLNSLMVPTIFDELTDLAAGTSTLYMKASANGASVPVLASQPSTLSAGAMWYEGGSLKYYDGASSTVKTLGTTTMGSALAMGGNAVTGLANPTSAQDAATKSYADSKLGGKTVGAPTLAETGKALRWNNGSDAWEYYTPTPALGFTPVNKAGDTSIGSLSIASEATFNFGHYTNTQESTLTGGLGTSDKGKTWYNSDTNLIKYWNGSSAQVLVNGGSSTFAGDVSGSASATSVDKIKGKSVSPAAYAAGQYLRFDGTNWINAALAATDVTGTLAVGNGGTGATSLGSGNILIGGGTGAVTSLASGMAGNIVYATGVAAWTSASPDTAGIVDKSSIQTVSGAKAFSTNITMNAQNPVRFADSDSDHYVALRAPAAVASDQVFTLPATLGTNGQVLTTNNLGEWSWSSITSSQWTTATSDIYYNTGNVGIGTSSPATALDLNGAFNVRGMAAPAVSDTGQGRIYFDSTANKFKVSQNGGAYADLVGGGSGTIAGTTNALAKFTSGTAIGDSALSEGTNYIASAKPILWTQGSSAVDNLMYLSSSSSGAVNASMGFFAAGYGSGDSAAGPYFLARGNSFSHLSTQRGNIYFSAGNPSGPDPREGSINFLTGTDTSRMIITNSGRIGISTTSPDAKLDVVDASTATSAIIVPRAAAFTGTAVNGMVRYNTDNNLFEFRQNGSWVNYTTVSDGRLKTNVVPVSGGLQIVEQLNPVYYDWDRRTPRTRAFEDKHQVGFIAQEVERVLPEVVNKGADTYRSIEYGKIVAVVVAALKELHEKVLGIESTGTEQARELASLQAGKADTTHVRKLEADVEALKAENAAFRAWICSKEPTAPPCR